MPLTRRISSLRAPFSEPLIKRSFTDTGLPGGYQRVLLQRRSEVVGRRIGGHLSGVPDARKVTGNRIAHARTLWPSYLHDAAMRLAEKNLDEFIDKVICRYQLDIRRRNPRFAV